MVNEIINLIVLATSIFNFIMLVFLYKRDNDANFSYLISAAALFIAAGQGSYIIHYFYKTLTCDWVQAIAQLGLAIVIGLSRGSVKVAAKKIVTHAVISDKMDSHKRAA